MTVLIILVVISILVAIVPVYLKLEKFGKFPSGERLERIKRSPNYKNGKFHNQHKTPMLIKNISYYKMIKKMIFSNNKPKQSIPATKTDLLNLNPSDNIMVWFGHSSYFIQAEGKTILVDPVLSGSASPFPWGLGMRSFKGSDQYTVADLPEIDYLVITHDHWDHLDYGTMLQLKPKVKKIICSLGVGEHFEYWGFPKNILIENDWYEASNLEDNFKIHTLPARHFSGRTFTRNKTQWSSFMLETGKRIIYLGGDSGYDNHFAKIAEKFPKIDLAILENGQYNRAWKYIHMLPNEFIRAARDLKANRIMPVHNSKFALAYHRWNSPLKKVTKFNTKIHLPLITPMIGELVDLDNAAQQFSKWWVK